MSKRVLVFSIALEGYERLFESCIDSQRQYCQRHGYHYVLIDHAPRRLQPVEAAWLKVSLLRSALCAGFTWVAFIDADCDVRSGMPGFPEYLDRVGRDKSIFFAPGYTGRINSGVAFARNTSAAVGFFQAVLCHADQSVPREDYALYENGHMIFFGKNNPDVYLLEHELWNNNSKLDQESYIQHYSGGNLRTWYMNNRAPVEFRSTPQGQIRNFMKKVPRKVRNVTNRLLRREPSMLASIDELMPYYEKEYPAFSSKLPNP